MYAANAWNLFDMHGNVAEWTLDSRSAYSLLIGGSDPFTAMENERVIRGGSWQGDGQDCRSASRRGRDPELASASTGFRVAIVQTTR